MLSYTDICLEMQPTENWSIHMYKYSLNLGKYSKNKLFLVQFTNICSFSCWWTYCMTNEMLFGAGGFSFGPESLKSTQQNHELMIQHDQINV